MKKTIMSIIMSLVATIVVAQTSYYPGDTGTVTKSGYTYKYRPILGLAIGSIELYNASNTYLDVEWAHRDGSHLSTAELSDLYDDSYYYSQSSMTNDQLLNLAMGYFTAQQKTTLKGSWIGIDVQVDTVTGKVTDVSFLGTRNSRFVTIPVETFRSIELAIKERLNITATAEGRKFNYVRFSGDLEF
jgi:hypothetical protein